MEEGAECLGMASWSCSPPPVHSHFDCSWAWTGCSSRLTRLYLVSVGSCICPVRRFSGILMEWLSCYPTSWTSEKEITVLVYNDITYLKAAAFPCLVLTLQSVPSFMLLCIKATTLEAEEVQPVPRHVSVVFLPFLRKTNLFGSQ